MDKGIRSLTSLVRVVIEVRSKKEKKGKKRTKEIKKWLTTEVQREKFLRKGRMSLKGEEEGSRACGELHEQRARDKTQLNAAEVQLPSNVK